MPAAYEKMRDAFIRQGMGEKAAKGKAARIYNSKRGDKPPVTRGSDNRDNRDNRGKDFSGA